MTNKKRTFLNTTNPKLSEIKKEVYQLAQVSSFKNRGYSNYRFKICEKWNK